MITNKINKPMRNKWLLINQKPIINMMIQKMVLIHHKVLGMLSTPVKRDS